MVAIAGTRNVARHAATSRKLSSIPSSRLSNRRPQVHDVANSFCLIESAHCGPPYRPVPQSPITAILNFSFEALHRLLRNRQPVVRIEFSDPMTTSAPSGHPARRMSPQDHRRSPADRRSSAEASAAAACRSRRDLILRRTHDPWMQLRPQELDGPRVLHLRTEVRCSSVGGVIDFAGAGQLRRRPPSPPGRSPTPSRRRPFQPALSFLDDRFKPVR